MSDLTVYTTAVSYSGGSTATATGVDTVSGDTVTFGGDWRPMRDLAEALQAAVDTGADLEDLPVAEVPSWAVLNRTASSN